MTADELVDALARCRRRIKVLRDDNQRLWESREKWKAKYRIRSQQNNDLRRQVRRAREQRDMWRSHAPRRVSGKPGSAGVHLTERDLGRILAIPARD